MNAVLSRTAWVGLLATLVCPSIVLAQDQPGAATHTSQGQFLPTVHAGGDHPPEYRPFGGSSEVPCLPGTLPYASPTSPTPWAPIDPRQPQADGQQVQPDGQQLVVPPAQAPTTDSTAALFGPVGGGESSESTGSHMVMAGRADSANRFNLFDNMSAIPMSRVWFSYLYADNYDTFLRSSIPGEAPDQRQHSNLYRMGVEMALTQDFSVAFQGQYISYGQDQAWANPQLLFKYALVNSPSTVLSATMGFQFEMDPSNTIIREPTTRFLPGMLLFQGLGDNAFFQGGFQFNVVDDNRPTSFDHALTFGYWLYRDPSLDVSGRVIPTNYCGTCGMPPTRSSRWLTGIIPEVGIYGKHLMVGGNRAGTNYNLPSRIAGDSSLFYSEGRNIYDVTSSVRFIFGRMSLNGGISVPVTGPRVRDFEVMGGLNVNF